MRKPILCTIVLAGLCFLLAPSQARAQYAYGISDIASSRNSRQVYGYSGTWLDYYAGYYYDPAVGGELYWQYNNELPLSKGYSEGYADWIPAEVWTVTSTYQPLTRYTVYSNHFVRAYYYYSSCSGFSGGCYSDPYGFSSFFGPGSGSFGGGYYNPYYYVTSRRYYLGTTSDSLTTPSDSCSNGSSFDEAGNTCPGTGPVVTPTPPQTDGILLTVQHQSLRPDGTGGTTSMRVNVQTNPAGRSVTLTAEAPTIPNADNFGGHIESAHVGEAAARPRGRFAAARGTTNSAGVFETTYFAPVFNGIVKIVATSGTRSANFHIRVEVGDLSQLNEGDDYNLIGATTSHPSNHWGTAEANTGLAQIGTDYRNEYYRDRDYPAGEQIAYNDQSLQFGGKFDIRPNWSTASAAHAEHRVGINCDTRSNNIPGARWERLNEIFRERGSTRTHDETNTDAPHWHLRFEFNSQAARAQRAAANYVPEAWWGALEHDPNDDDWAYWTGRVKDAQALGYSQTFNEAKALGRSLFYSAEYVGRNRSDEDYLRDLYVTYLLRDPDQGGFNFWLGVLRNDNASGINGREHLVRAFEESGEFAEVAASLSTMTGSLADPSMCDTVAEQDCYNVGGAWNSTSCSCSYIEPEPQPDPCMDGGYYTCTY